MIILGSITYSASEITLYVDGSALVLDQPPVVINGRTMVPVAAICDALNMEVKWDGKTSTVFISNEDVQIELTLNNKVALINNEKIELDVPATSIKGRTMVPASFIAKAVHAEVSWDSKSNSVIITSNQNQINLERQDELYHTKTFPSHDYKLFYKDKDFIDLLKKSYNVHNHYGDWVVNTDVENKLDLSIFDKSYYTEKGVVIREHYNAFQLHDKNGSIEEGTRFILGMNYKEANTINFRFMRFDIRQFDLIELVLANLIDAEDASSITKSIKDELAGYLLPNELYNDKIDVLSNAVRYYRGYKITYTVSGLTLNNQYVKSVVSFTIE